MMFYKPSMNWSSAIPFIPHTLHLLALSVLSPSIPPGWVLSSQSSFLHHSGRINASAVRILSGISLLVLSLECFAPESHEVSLLQVIQFSAEYLHPRGFLCPSCPKQHLPPSLCPFAKPSFPPSSHRHTMQ